MTFVLTHETWAVAERFADFSQLYELVWNSRDECQSPTSALTKSRSKPPNNGLSLTSSRQKHTADFQGNRSLIGVTHTTWLSSTQHAAAAAAACCCICYITSITSMWNERIAYVINSFAWSSEFRTFSTGGWPRRRSFDAHWLINASETSQMYKLNIQLGPYVSQAAPMQTALHVISVQFPVTRGPLGVI